ncbi:hypothetical protein K505DRAFT_299580 [Melanomma pulvis-pyrius CBS 109.77]|uniref:N-acetyltransferase domain-containing protein n=1 Tax=Melanomma pulvis-pyrius CBS 109.77 TaxID=1314802 RepID=A0A6A6XMK8_9PLEO|nr:hypothetical protein K505DRAFT_299580 [Melanomma pulvis-pyrius CBS 109.77]
MTASAPTQDDVIVSLVASEDDIASAFHITAATFGRQSQDGIWIATNPRWETSAGKAEGIARFVSRWKSTTTDNKGRPNTLFLKASIEGKIVGFAIWQQASFVPGHGDPPTDDLGGKDALEALHPGNETEQRFTRQIFASLVKRRLVYVKEKEKATPPAIFVLDLCAVDPDFQRRGIAGKLVQFGLDEARKRGLEATTEASSMGRGVYERMGFWAEGEVNYTVDEEFAGRVKPANVFMRTGKHT